MIERAATFCRAEGVLAQEAHGETVLLRLSDGSYDTLDEVGAMVWDRCDGATPVEAIVVAICAEFDAEPDTVRGDVGELITGLIDEKLLATYPVGHDRVE